MKRPQKDMKKRPWKDVPEDILGLVLSKLHHTDRCRFRAVCKNWQVTQDGINQCPDTPWMIHYDLNQPENTVNCEWMDPYNPGKSHQVSKRIRPDLNVHLVEPRVCYSNYDWNLVGYEWNKELSFVLHNPFSNDLIVLPQLIRGQPARYYSFNYAAVFTGNPASPDQSDCEVLVLVYFYMVRGRDVIYIGRYPLSRSRKNKWSVKRLEYMISDAKCGFDMQHIDGKLYCLFYNEMQRECILASYSLANNKWKSGTVRVYDEEAGRVLDWEDRDDWSWLTQMGGDLIMLCTVREPGTYQYIWMVFRFNWGHWRWVLVKDLKNAAFFVCDENRIICHAPLGGNNQDCLIIHPDMFSDGLDDCPKTGLKCYSFQQRDYIRVPEPYAWIVPDSSEYSFRALSFIPPPMYRKPGP